MQKERYKKRDLFVKRDLFYGAEDGAQTRDPQLGRLMLYQLSYFRKYSLLRKVGDDGFEPPKSKTADLQSAPFGHSGNRPFL